jgi:hypothetical protein
MNPIVILLVRYHQYTGTSVYTELQRAYTHVDIDDDIITTESTRTCYYVLLPIYYDSKSILNMLTHAMRYRMLNLVCEYLGII